MKTSPGAFLMLVASVLLGAILANAAMPYVFAVAPNDMARSRTLLAALEDPPTPPVVCVFGNSVVMSGVDTRQLGKGLAGEPETWNLGTTGQSLLEGALYYQDLPNSVQVVVQCVAAGDFESEVTVSPNKYNALFMYGYRPSQNTLRMVEEHATRTSFEQLCRSELANRFQSRWAIRAAIDTELRQILRRDLALDKVVKDLYFPAVGHTRVSRRVVEGLLREYLHPREPGFHPNEQFVASVLELDRICREQERRFVLVVLPSRSEIREHLGEPFLKGLDDFCSQLHDEHGIITINAVDLFREDDVFVDVHHLDKVGAEKLTAYLANELERRGACSSIHPNSSSSR
ncbi:MAG: hypothetical protein JW818_23680 [Pirellulales bacterium]|nr:hypothetical protein [Pirellulales bacterium]